MRDCSTYKFQYTSFLKFESHNDVIEIDMAPGNSWNTAKDDPDQYNSFTKLKQGQDVSNDADQTAAIK